MLNDRKARIRAEADRISRAFLEAGAVSVEANALQPAETLLDLYGEDIRARAYVTRDPEMGEQMLRPDFTVPVVQMHMAEGAEPARYTYNGPVWRKQEPGSHRATEYIQVGFELFDRSNPAASDTEVFALFARVLNPLGLRAATGDLGILLAAVKGLKTTERRKQALLRHIWRPKRFRQLLDRFGGKVPNKPFRVKLIGALAAKGADAVLAQAGPAVGLRSQSEIHDRLDAIAEDAVTPDISSGEVALLDEILSLRASSVAALSRLRDIEVDMPALGPALERMERRLAAMSAAGIAVETLEFEASFGRTTLEYYDGFVFGFFADNRPDLPIIASGGRYDALTRVLGQGRSIPAVGGVIRPEFILALQEAR